MTTMTVSTGADLPAFDVSPPGERYFRHPGDVVRLAVWGITTIVVAVLVGSGTATAQGVSDDVASVFGQVADGARELLLVLVQAFALGGPFVILVGLVARARWRRIGLLALAAAVGALLWLGLDLLLDLPGRLPGALSGETWIATTRFPTLPYLTGAAAVTIVGKPWLSRSWRRAADMALTALAVVMAIAGIAGVPELALAAAAGATGGAAVLVLFGAPNRRPTPAAVAAALEAAGLPVRDLDLRRAEGGRTQLYAALPLEGDPVFLKVYSRDSRDADLLYRAFRTALLRGTADRWPSADLRQQVAYEGFLMMLAERGGVRCPRVAAVAPLRDGSVVLAMEDVDGARLDAVDAGGPLDDDTLDAVWHEVQLLHDTGLAHRALRAGNVLETADGPVLIDFGFGETAASARMRAVDRAELLASTAAVTDPQRAVAAAARVLPAADLATTLPFLQPLALSSATRHSVSKSVLAELRGAVSEATGEEPPPLERLVRVRPRTLLIIAMLVGAFYVLLPQLANVDDSVKALRHANYAWLAVSLVMSVLTYVASAVGLAGGVTAHLPFGPNLDTQLASSFVNRVSPANVGGMALNVRFLQKLGLDSAEAVTGVGLNSLVGGVVHLVLLTVFLAWAGQSGGSGFSIPSGSKALVVIAVVLALLGVVLATRRGRRLIRTRVVTFLQRSWRSMTILARMPAKLVALCGGSMGVTLAYIASLAAACAAFKGGVSIAEVGAVYLGASVVASAAPTPGGLGAMEAALVAGFTGVGMDSGKAVAAVLAYRLLTYWLPILPGWWSFHRLDRRGLI
jgi:undecaprenyl-diphosphatase